MIETLDPRAFKSVSLTELDLSYNKILDLTAGVFEPLIRLTTLKLAGNALQVLDSGMTLGLVMLSYLDLKDNDIIKVEDNALTYCHSLTTLTLTGRYKKPDQTRSIKKLWDTCLPHTMVDP